MIPCYNIYVFVYFISHNNFVKEMKCVDVKNKKKNKNLIEKRFNKNNIIYRI